jgi:NCS1 family nucleobase:cation symporter-1
MYGTAYWNPYNLLDGVLEETYTSKSRAGIFFASASFAFATLGTSIACNIVPFAADVTCLAPKWINIIRGQFLCLIIAFAVVPWRIVATANGFLSFLNGYSIFRGPVVGTMLVDYFIIRKGNMDLVDMYTTSPLGRYFYFLSTCVRMAHSLSGCLLPLPGFVASFGHTIGAAAVEMSDFGWVLSFLMGGLCYYIVCMIWKALGIVLWVASRVRSQRTWLFSWTRFMSMRRGKGSRPQWRRKRIIPRAPRCD